MNSAPDCKSHSQSAAGRLVHHPCNASAASSQCTQHVSECALDLLIIVVVGGAASTTCTRGSCIIGLDLHTAKKTSGNEPVDLSRENEAQPLSNLAGKADETTGASCAAKPRLASMCTCCCICICLSHQSTPHLSSAAVDAPAASSTHKELLKSVGGTTRGEKILP